MTLEKKIFLITGAAAGIGLATAKLAIAQGATVILADLDAKTGQSAAEQLGATFLPVNIAEEASVQTLFAEIAKNYGRLDVLVNAAGILKGAYVDLEELDVETWQSVIDVNLTGSYLCAKYAVSLLRLSQHAVILFVSSLAAVFGSSSYAYGASKGGVNSLALTLERKLASENIRVNVVMPGNIDTGLKRNVIATEAAQRGQSFETAMAASHLGSPDGVAQVLVWLAGEEADYVRGVVSTR